MELGAMPNSFLDASGDRTTRFGEPTRDPGTGIPRRELETCELRASASGFRPNTISLLDLDPVARSVDVGAIVVHRAKKIEGKTISAGPYRAPKDARSAYEKGMEAEKNGKLVVAATYFEKAVTIYPAYMYAWFQLGTIREKENQQDAARAAYTRATSIDTKYLPPYLALARMAGEAENWTEVLRLTGHILDLDPLRHAAATDYMVDLDQTSYSDAYFLNALANYRLNRFEEAEKIALKTEHIDLWPRFPQVHLLLAGIFTHKNDYAGAISELETYLELVPQGSDTGQVRKELARLQKLNVSSSTSEKPEQK